jgi:glycosyltransferase involved in cell wall biosynthesis
VRILIVNWRDLESPWAGGAEVQIHAVAERLAARGHEILMLVSGFPRCAPETTLRGVRIRRHGTWWNANWVLQREAKRECASGRWDIVFEDVNKIPFFTPLVVRQPVAVLVPHLFGATIFRETNPLFGAYLWLMERPIPLVYRKSFMLPVSESTRADLIRRGIHPEHAVVVHNGLDFERYQLASPPPRNPHPTLVHIGRLMRYKSADVAVRALAHVRRALPQARLVMAGDGPDRARLERLAARLGLADAVEFRGFVSHADKVDLLWRSHVLLNASPKEGWGLTVLEANACGVPVVASRRPGLVDSVRDRDTGILVPYGDAAAFGAAALELLSDPALHAAYAARGRDWARRFTWDEAAVQTERVLERALGAHEPPARGANGADRAAPGLASPGTRH